MTPRIPEDVEKGDWLPTSLSSEDLRILRQAASMEGESLGTWLRGLAVRSAMAGKKVTAAPEPASGGRGERWTSRATAAQKQTVAAAAEKNKLTVSDYIRSVGLARAKDLGIKT